MRRLIGMRHHPNGGRYLTIIVTFDIDYQPMKKLILLVLLIACGPSGQGTDPDANLGPPLQDPTAPTPTGNGCNTMGNLPFSRTKTYVLSDPVDPALLNELQDQAVGAKRPEFFGRQALIPYYQVGWTTPTAGLQPWCSSSATTNEAWYQLSIESGDHLKGFRFDVWGNGGGSLTVLAYGDQISNYAIGGGPQIYQAIATPPNGAWTKYRADDVSTNFGTGLVFTTPTFNDSDILTIKFSATTTGVRITNIRPILNRP